MPPGIVFGRLLNEFLEIVKSFIRSARAKQFPEDRFVHHARRGFIELARLWEKRGQYEARVAMYRAMQETALVQVEQEAVDHLNEAIGKRRTEIGWLTLRAPDSGTVSIADDVPKLRGRYLKPGTPLCRLNRSDRLEALLVQFALVHRALRPAEVVQ